MSSASALMMGMYLCYFSVSVAGARAHARLHYWWRTQYVWFQSRHPHPWSMFCSVLLSCRPMNPITYTNISRSIAQPTASHHLSFALLGNLIAENVPIVSFTKSSSSFFGGGGADADVHSCISRAVCWTPHRIHSFSIAMAAVSSFLIQFNHLPQQCSGKVNAPHNPFCVGKHFAFNNFAEKRVWRQ